MTRSMSWIGFLATLLIVVSLGMAALREPNRQAEASADLQQIAVAEGTDLYVENCAVCHGAVGEGLSAVPSLANDGVRNMDYQTLFRTIERGRYNTAMAAYGVNEGGIFTNAQIDSLVAMIQYAEWDTVGARVAALGLTPPQTAVIEISVESLAAVRELVDGDTLANGLELYAENCVACHGSNGEGSALAPALNTAELRDRLTDDAIIRTIAQGVPGTLMAAWNRALDDQQVTDLTALIRRWDELEAAGIVMPKVEAPTVDMSPEAIASGQRLYSILCSQCHGIDGYGTQLAPALNSQTFLNQTPDSAIQQIIGLGVSGTAMPAWGGRLTEADIAALTAYLRSWEPTAPVIVQPSANINSPTRTVGPPWRQQP